MSERVSEQTANLGSYAHYKSFTHHMHTSPLLFLHFRVRYLFLFHVIYSHVLQQTSISSHSAPFRLRWNCCRLSAALFVFFFIRE